MMARITDLAAFGMTALITQNRNFTILNNRVDQGIEHFKEPIGQLKKKKSRFHSRNGFIDRLGMRFASP